jgi:hypothetical protein
MATMARFFSPTQVNALRRQFVPQRTVMSAESWDAPHSQYPGKYLIFWQMKMMQVLGKGLAAPGSAYDGASGYAKRVAADPTSGAKIQAWLRANFSGPRALIDQAAWTTTPTEPTVPRVSFTVPLPHDPKHFTWNYQYSYDVARWACIKYLNDQCLASAGKPFNPATGECSTVQSGDSCQPMGAGINDVKDYRYMVQPDDLVSFWKIPAKFNMPIKTSPNGWTWHQLRNANYNWPGGFVVVNGACMLNGLRAGDLLRVPASWREPKPGVEVLMDMTAGMTGAPLVRRRMPIVTQSPGRQVALTDTWDTMHPQYAGPYIIFWTKKLLQLLPEVPLIPMQVRNQSQYDQIFSGLGIRMAGDPATEARVQAWLRANFSGPAAFINEIARVPGSNSNPITGGGSLVSPPRFPPPYAPRFFLWGYENTDTVAVWGCRMYMGYQCMAASNLPYNVATGECGHMEGKTFGSTGAPLVRRRMPMVKASVSRPEVSLGITWDSRHPNWPGSFVAFWSQRIHESLRRYVKAGTGTTTELAPLAQRVANDPNCQVKLIAWLRDRWSGPQAFVQYLPGSPDTLPTLTQLASYTWSSAGLLSHFAATLYLNRVCHSAGPGWVFYPPSGECKRISDGT